MNLTAVFISRLLLTSRNNAQQCNTRECRIAKKFFQDQFGRST